MSSYSAVFGGRRRVPPPVNEPVKSYAPGSPERAALKARLKRWPPRRVDMPLVIGGREIRTGDTAQAVMPHDHRHVLGRLPQGHRAARGAGDRGGRGRARASGRAGRGRIARRCSSRPPSCSTTTWRATINAATMLGQSKTAFQAEIDAACGARRLLALQRALRAGAARRAADHDHSDVEPARLPAARGLRLRGHAVQLHVDRRQPADRAALMGNTVIWKPASSAMLSRLLPDEAARGGGPAARRHQLRRRATRR